MKRVRLIAMLSRIVSALVPVFVAGGWWTIAAGFGQLSYLESRRVQASTGTAASFFVRGGN